MSRYIALFLIACGGDDAPPALFPETYAATYTEVRNCRNSIDHDLRRIRVLSSPEALTAYTGRTEAFPPMSIVIKVEYEDMTCSGPIVGFTAMQKLAPGTDPALLDWRWQETDGDLKEIAFEPARCASCHKTCQDSYDATCTLP